MRPDASRDLGFLTLRMPRNSAPCTASRLGPRSLELRLAQAREAFLENFELTAGRRLQRMEIVERSTDALGGTIFLIEAIRQAEPLHQGMSGGLVSDAEGPLGLLLEVDRGQRGHVLRMDVVRQTFDAMPPVGRDAVPWEGQLVAALVGGLALSPEGGVPQAIAEARPLHIRARGRTVDILLHWPAPVVFAGVAIEELAAEEQGRVGIELGTPRGEGEWVRRHACVVAVPAPMATCRLQPTLTVAARIRLVTQQPTLMTMARVDVLR